MQKYLRKGNLLLYAVLLATDTLVVTGAFLLAYLIRSSWGESSLAGVLPLGLSESIASMKQHAPVLLLVLPLWQGMLIGTRVFRPSRTAKLFDTAWTVVASVFMATGILGALAFAFRFTFISRGVLLLFVLLSALFLAVEKCTFVIAFRRVRRRNRNLVFVLVVGTGARAREFITDLESHPEWGMRVVGLVDKEPDRVGGSVGGHEVIGQLTDIPRILVDNVIDLVAFVVPRAWIGDIGESVRHCELQGVDVQVALDLFPHDIGTVHITNLGRFPFLALRATTVRPWQAALKRTMDLALSGAALLVLSPLLFFVAVAIKLDSGGPVLYLQKRHGLHGREFRIWKFRTMVPNADKLLEELRGQNEMSGAAFKMAGDPRVTRVGRALRRLSLDELPQLVNVLKGDMSLVGPRPLLATEKDRYEEWQRRRMSMRPGLTCLWQINGRNEVDFEHWMQLDLNYIDNWSIATDIKIIAKTIPAVLQGRGAY
jgi:exopolysaccharide biosynthesis polyprenyl glycosylphosphotransferase